MTPFPLCAIKPATSPDLRPLSASFLYLAAVLQRHGRGLAAGDAHHHLIQQGAHHLAGGRLVAGAARAHLAGAVEAPGKHLRAGGH